MEYVGLKATYKKTLCHLFEILFGCPILHILSLHVLYHIFSVFFICQCWEENPDVYGIRRSGRSRKEPERLRVNESDSGEKVRSKRNSRQSSRK